MLVGQGYAITKGPARAAPEEDLRLYHARSSEPEKALPELFCFQLGGWSGPSLFNFPAVTPAFLNPPSPLCQAPGNPPRLRRPPIPCPLRACVLGEAHPGGAPASGLPSSEPMKMTTCTVVVNWR